MRLPKWFVSISVLASIGIAVGWLWAGDKIGADVTSGSPETTAEPAVAPVQYQAPTPYAVDPAPDLSQAQTTAPPAVSGPPPVAVQIESPVQTANPPQIPAPSAPAGIQSQTATPGPGSPPEQAAEPPLEVFAPLAAIPEPAQTAQAEAPIVNPLVPPYRLQTLVDERRDQLRRQRDARLDAYRGPRRHMPPWFAAYDDSVERYRDARRSRFRRQRDLGRQRHTSWMDAVCPWSKPRRDRSARRSYQRQMEQLDRRTYRDAFIDRPMYGFSEPGGWR